MFHIININEMV